MIYTVVECDKCGEAIQWYGSRHKGTLIMSLRSEGWSVGKPRGKYKSIPGTLCPKCRRGKKAKGENFQ